jgi:hypothetical protein
MPDEKEVLAHAKELNDLCDEAMKEYKKNHNTQEARAILAPQVEIIDARLKEHHYVR